MISIRENVFETNSSSMHAITVACALDDDKLYKDYLVKELKRWENKKGGYDIKIACDEEKLDEDDYTVRRYVPHFSINDKLMYAFATVAQHYNKSIVYAPYKPFNFEALPKKKRDKYFGEVEEWKNKYTESNNKTAKEFEERINSFKDSLEWYIKDKLELDDKKINVHFIYHISPEGEIFWFPEKSYFSTGCYGNEEFYMSLTDHHYSFAEWICNPYSAVLAGSDEQDRLDYLKQDFEAHRCIEEAYKHMQHDDTEDIIQELEEDKEGVEDESYVKEVDDMIARLKAGENFFPNTSKLIYPLGG